MNSLWWQAHGPIEDLLGGGVPDPQPGPGQLLIEVKAASINVPDMHIAQGHWQFKLALIRRLDRRLPGCHD